MDPERLSDIQVADVVMATAGREKGKLFYVLEVDEQYLILGNGKDRTLEQPKRKKRRHVDKVLRSETRVAEKLRQGDKVLNSELREDLAELRQKMQSHNQGGF